MAWSPDGTYLATAGGDLNNALNPELTLWPTFERELKAMPNDEGAASRSSRPDPQADASLKVAGKTPAAKDPFANPPPKWPASAGELAGDMEVRIQNPNSIPVRVGLRSNGRGRDFVVAGNANQSVRVPNGKYTIYFQFSDRPDKLFQGDDFTLNNNGVEIQIVKVVNGNFGIREVK